MTDARDSRQVLVEDNETTSFETTPGVEVLSTFDGMGLRQDLMRGIYAYGTLLSVHFRHLKLVIELVLFPYQLVTCRIICKPWSYFYLSSVKLSGPFFWILTSITVRIPRSFSNVNTFKWTLQQITCVPRFIWTTHIRFWEAQCYSTTCYKTYV